MNISLSDFKTSTSCLGATRSGARRALLPGRKARVNERRAFGRSFDGRAVSACRQTYGSSKTCSFGATFLWKEAGRGKPPKQDMSLRDTRKHDSALSGCQKLDGKHDALLRNANKLDEKHDTRNIPILISSGINTFGGFHPAIPSIYRNQGGRMAALFIAKHKEIENGKNRIQNLVQYERR